MSGETIATEYGQLSKRLSRARLLELCLDKEGVQTGPFGTQLHQSDYVIKGTPIITVEHLGENRIIHSDTPFVSDSDKLRLNKYTLQEGDIVFSRVGSVDRRALVRGNEDGWLFSGRCLRVRVNRKKIDPVYLSYFFGLNSFKNHIRNIAVGATMPSINTKILSEIPIYFPSLINQKKIGKILLEIDDKIELNRQLNQTLEDIAQAIFKCWFVDFDPVKAKMQAKAARKSPEDIETAAMEVLAGGNDISKISAKRRKELAKIAKLFPDELVDSELGPIPRGWGVKKVKDICTVVNGRAYKNTEFKENGTPIVRIQNLTGKGKTVFSDLDLDADKFIEAEDLIYAWSATFGPYIWRGPKSIYHYHIWKMKPNEDLVDKYYLYYCFQGLTEQMKSQGTGSIFTHLTKSLIEGQNILVPDKEIKIQISRILKNIFLTISSRIAENKNLTEIKDNLLPQLLSGKLKI